MNSRLSESILKLLCCPICKSNIVLNSNLARCVNDHCRAEFPIIDGIPILINEDASVFSLEDFVQGRTTTLLLEKKPLLQELVTRTVPSISLNLKAKKNYARFASLLSHQCEAPKVLVIGGGIIGRGMQHVLDLKSIEFVESDVSFGPRTGLICDAHDIPFENESFDGVIAQAVLEHVVDPYRCVEEMHRVLKHDGLIYAETPFMQQVHMGRYDFTRFTHLGHRRLFREFEEIAGGAMCGPGMALAWSYQYFLMSFVRSKAARRVVQIFARMTSFWLKYFDFYLIDKPGSLDAASAYYFLGKKSSRTLPDRELIRLYRGILG